MLHFFATHTTHTTSFMLCRAGVELGLWEIRGLAQREIENTYQLYLEKGVVLKDPETGVLHLLKKRKYTTKIVSKLIISILFIL